MLTVVDKIIKETHWIKIAITSVQTKVLGACEPILEHAAIKQTEFLNNLVIKCIEYLKNNLENQTEEWKLERFKRKLIYGFLRNDPTYIGFLSNSINLNLTINEDIKNKSIKFIIEQQRELETYKLKAALFRYVDDRFIEIKNIKIVHGAQGFELEAVLFDKDNNQYFLNTRAIGAGGYNIQIFHYRYIISLSSPTIKKEVIRQQITQREKEERETRKKEKEILRQERRKGLELKEKISLIRSIKEKLNWANYYVRTVDETPDKFNEIEKQRRIDNRNEIFKIYDKYYENDKLKFKKEQLIQMIQNNQIPESDFETIKKIRL